jgi:hypothetical protein
MGNALIAANQLGSYGVAQKGAQCIVKIESRPKMGNYILDLVREV